MEYTDLGFSASTQEELDRIAVEQGGIVGTLPGQCSIQAKISPNGDWTARWINTGGLGNAGTLILIPLNARTRRLKRRGTIAAWMAAGLSAKQAEILYGINIPYKHELMRSGVLVKVLSSSELKTAFVAHPGDYGPGTNRNKWLQRWSHLVGPLELSAPRETSMAIAIKAIVK